MVDVNLANYKGILYPLDLDHGSPGQPSGAAAVDLLVAEPSSGLKPLVDLCAEKTVMDATSTARALSAVPRELYYSLMRAALVKTRDRSIEVLISKWPWPVLSLRKLAPSMFDSLSTLYSAIHVTERMRRGVKYTTCLAHTFVECLKKRTPTKLKYLDLTGYPAAEVIVNYLSSHVLLVYNEARQKEIISLYNKVTHDWPQEQRHNYNLDTTLPDDIFLICVDAFVQTSDTHMELCRALKTSKSDACRFRLRVSKLDLTCVGAARTSVLLEQIDPKHLTALCLQFNGLTNEGLTIVGPAIQRFKSLTALDLSCNNISVVHELTAVLLAQTLGALPQLRRLNLSNNVLKCRTRCVLGAVPGALQYLKMCACSLVDQDLVYLRTSHHLAALRELDLSENNLGRYAMHTEALLAAMRGTIVVLELEDCSWPLNLWNTIFLRTPRLTALRYLNISHNMELNADSLITVISQLTALPCLEVVTASYPSECFVSPYDEERNDAMKLFFHHKLNALLDTICQGMQRQPLKLALKA